jgi:hypothetical protein
MSDEQSRLYKDNEEFFACLDEAMKLINQPLLCQEPADGDKPSLKNLLAMYMTGVFEPETLARGAENDPEITQKVGIIRMTLLAGYNLGRMRGKWQNEVYNPEKPE